MSPRNSSALSVSPRAVSSVEPAAWTVVDLEAAGSLLALYLGILILFSPTSFFSFLVLDDPAYVLENQNVRSGVSVRNLAWAFTSLHGDGVSYWHPLTWLSHQLDSQLFGLNPGLHHLMNVLLYALTTVLVFCFVRQLGMGNSTALFISGCFAFHPLHVESVAWISERKDLLSALFYLLTLSLYLEFRRTENKRIYLASIVTAVFALMSKPTAVTLPLSMLLLSILPPKPGQNLIVSSPYRTLFRLLPFVVGSALVSAITIHAQMAIGAVQSLAGLSLSERLDNVWWNYFSYLRRFIFPADLCAAYGPDPLAQRFGIVALIPLLAATLLLWRFRQRFRFAAFGWFSFLVMLLPMIGILQVGPQASADRYMFLPVLMLLFVAVDFWRVLFDRLQRSLVFIGGAAICVCLAATTARQMMYWRDSVSVFTRAAEKQPEFWFAQLGLAGALANAGSFDEALERARCALNLPGNSAEAHRIAGLCLFKKRSYAEALEHYKLAYELRPDPRVAISLARLYSGHEDGALRNTAEAVRFANEALNSLPRLDGGALLTLGTAFAAGGDIEKGVRFFQAAATFGKNAHDVALLGEVRRRSEIYLNRAVTGF